MKRATLILILAVIVFPCFAETYQVMQKAPTADDRNPGSQEKPWKTISRAAEALKPGDCVIVHEGVYREWVQPKNSGTEGAPIVYEAAKDEKANQVGKFLIDPEQLKMVIGHNLYWESPEPAPDASKKRCLILYGASWRPKSEQYDSLDAWKKAHSFDHDSECADPMFVDWQKGDFRLRPDSPAIKLGAGLTEPAAGMGETVAKQ